MRRLRSGRLRRRSLLVAAALVAIGLPAGTAVAGNPIKKLFPSQSLNVPLLFSGYLWTPRNSTWAMPGPNAWSSSNAWVDLTGKLHLALKQNAMGKWQSAEVQSDRIFGYGTYKWSVETPLNNFDPNVALGMFTATHFATNHEPGELDIEVSRWTRWKEPKSAQFAVQPAQVKGHLFRTDVANAPQEFHMSWTPWAVEFWVTSYGETISDWYFMGPGIPEPADHHVAINLWQALSQPPSDGQPVEVVLTGFKYEPMS